MIKNLIFYLSLLFISINLFGQENPKRDSTYVKSALNAYDPAEWIVSTKEERKGDFELKKYPETDIKGVISCYDEDYLRFDILLYNPVNKKNPIFFLLELGYAGTYKEYFIYRTDTRELYIYYEEDGVIYDFECLTDNEEAVIDWAEITSSEGKADTNIVFIINKDYHFQDKKGSYIFLTAKFASGFYDAKEDELNFSDEAIAVDVYFKR